MRALAITFGIAIALVGCSGSASNDSDAGPTDAGSLIDAGPPACSATFSGNFSDQAAISSGCGTLSLGGTSGTDWLLQLTASSSVAGAQLRVKVDLGSAPTAGDFTDATLETWSAVAVGATSCEYSAGNLAVPAGSFELTLTEVSGLPSAPVAHGNLQILLHVSAPATVDCGAGDVEQAFLAF
ncbi:MAG: hypothetical protein JST54_24940 [Deltaproteobacteria bacterium]|nr:hypothetical protein [Deltaproteobacteria bacterium]